MTSDFRVGRGMTPKIGRYRVKIDRHVGGSKIVENRRTSFIDGPKG